MAPITIEIPGEPKGKGRPRFARGGIAYTPASTRSYEASLAWTAAAAMKGVKPLEGPLRVTIEAFVSIPTSWSKKRKQMAAAGEIRPVTKPDADNIAKLIDGCNNIVWRDDSQIVDAHIIKRYDARPRLVVTVSSIASREQEATAA